MSVEKYNAFAHHFDRVAFKTYLAKLQLVNIPTNHEDKTNSA